jgi:E3 ubiquitin-protein ligase HUWE1
VDITDTGIDPEFLEALPEDMRADVVQQHLREHRMAETPQQPAISTEISPEFLDALPPEIRAEVIQQEAMEAARRNAESRAGAASGGSAARVPQMFAGMPEMADIQEFLSTLDPGLSSTLMQGGMAGFGQQAVGGQAQNPMQALQESMARIASATGGASRQPQRGGQAEALQKKVAPRESIQLLEKSGIAALVRLLFFPDINKKDRLLKVLGNLCENGRSRSDVVNLLLSVLQDDSGDLSYVDKQTVIKPLKGATATPKATPKKKTTAENATSSAVMLAGLQSDSIPSFVAQRAFEALAYIAANNEQVLVYFLTEHELPASSAKYSKKGKSKDRQSTSTYPITVLLKLLDRETLFRSPGMADTLTALLASLTRPLASIAPAVSTNNTTTHAQEQGSVQTQEAAGESEPAPVLLEQSSTQPTAPPVGAELNPSGDNSAKTGEVTAEESATILKVAPSISEEILRMVPSILTHGECSSRTFSSTLSLIQNLTHIPGAKEIISSQLQDQAQHLGDTLRIDLEQLHQGLLQAEGSGEEVSVASFTPASSAQTKLLRVLKTIDYIYAPKDGQNHITWDASAITSIAEGTKSLTAEEEKVEGIFEAMHFTPLWDTLGSCLSVVERKDSMINIATVLLPLVESLMVVSKYGSAKAAASRSRIPSAALSPMSPKNAPDEEPFVVFTSRHRKVLNTMVRNNPSLMSGSFSLLILNPRVLEFDNKRNWFMQQLRKKPNRDVGGHIHLNIRRDEVFVDSYRALSNKSGETLKYGKLNIKFAGEEGVDAGGVTREWYSVLAQSIFNPGYCKWLIYEERLRDSAYW